MKSFPLRLMVVGLVLTGPAAWCAQPAIEVEPPVPVADKPVSAPAAPATDAAQRLYQPGRTLVPSDQAQAVVGAFGEAYAALGSPRIVIVVNRELVDTRAALRLTQRTEAVTTTEQNSTSTVAAPAATSGPSTQVNVAVGGSVAPTPSAPTGPGESSTRQRTIDARNTYAAEDTPVPTLADRQTTRDLERLFGRPLRIGGAQLADQRVVAALLAARPLDDVLAAADDAARRDREAVAKIADAVLEILISSRTLTLPGFTGSEVRTVPDLQATLIRLADGAILGQASATDVLGKDREAGPVVRNFDVRDIAEATALALIEDITLTAPAAASRP